MLERLINAAYDSFLENDTQELSEKQNEAVRKIMNENELTQNSLDDLISGICYEHEDVAFKAGFMACVDCIRALTGKEG